MKQTFFIIPLLICVTSIFSQDLSLYEKHWHIRGADTLPYRLLMPKNFDPETRYPLVLFLHGAGERGSDNELQLVHGAKLFLRDDVRDNFPAIIVFPQCPRNSYWSNVEIKQKEGKREFDFKATGDPSAAMAMVQDLAYTILKKYPVNRAQVYVMGLSMGGMGTFEIVRRNPDLFAAAVPICGGGAPSTAQQLRKVGWWVFHGAKDDVVPLKLSEEMVEALREVKAQVKFTVYPDANHNSWDPAFAEPELLEWLFSNKKK